MRHFNGTDWVDISLEEFEVLMQSYGETVDQKAVVQQRIEKCKSIMLEYLADNSLLNLTPEQNVQQLIKFQSIKAFLEVGNFKNSIALIEAASTDEVFTQERKDKYLAMFL